MEFRRATHSDLMKIIRAIGHKDLSYITKGQENLDYNKKQLYVVAEGDKVLACASLVWESEYEYFAVKRLCILNKRNCGRGIARFALRELQKVVCGRIGATPWIDNIAMRKLLESEGFKLEYKFNGIWCYYWKECMK